MLWLKRRKNNLAGREDIIEYFNMYRGKDNKIISKLPGLRVAQINEFLFINLEVIVNTSVVFVEDKKGTKIVVLDSNNNIIHQVIHPFIKPSSIASKGKMIPQKIQAIYSIMLMEAFDLQMFHQDIYDRIGAVEKVKYVKNSWDISKTLVYKLSV